jgi:hypothetical protein
MPHDYLRAALDGVRAKLHAEVDAQVGLLGTRCEEALERAVLERVGPAPATAMDSLPAVSAVSHLLDAFSDMDRQASLSGILTALVRDATIVAPRVALFIVNGTTLEEWAVPGIPLLSTAPLPLEADASRLLAYALRHNRTMPAGAAHEAPAPPMALLPAGRSAIAVPLAPGNQPVAVLYADEDLAGVATDGWRDMIELLVRHAAARLAYVTTIRTAEAMRLLAETDRNAGHGPDPAPEFDEPGARRYARLLVSEIKLYNEAAVREGRGQRDLLHRLGAEIARARQLYEAHVPATVPDRHAYFQQELVQTLAGGDPALLG